jgi:ketosteroid isomerase-like protein
LGASGRWVAIIRTEVTYLASFGASREKKMELAAYQRYLDHFNRRDYDGVVAHFCPDAEVRFAGVVLTGHQAIRDFYSFFHDYVIESISVTKFAASDELVALEANVRLEAKMDWTCNGFVPVT